MPKQGYGKRRPEDSPRFTPKYPKASSELNTRTVTRPDESTYTRVYKDEYDYAQRVPPPDAGVVAQGRVVGDVFSGKKKSKSRKQGYKDLR